MVISKSVVSCAGGSPRSSPTNCSTSQRADRVSACAPASVAPLLAQPLDLPAVARKLNVHILFEGVIHACGNRLRITARIVEASGFLISSERFDAQLGTPSLLKVSEQIASGDDHAGQCDRHPAGLRALPTVDNPSRQSPPLARLRWQGPRNVLRNTLGV